LVGTPENSAAPGRSRSGVATMWTMVLAWALVRVVAGSRQARPLPAEAGRLSRRSGSGFEEKQHASTAEVAEPGRGRQADSPTGIPARGWKDILWRVYEEFGKDRVMSLAAGVTYYALLAPFAFVGTLCDSACRASRTQARRSASDGVDNLGQHNVPRLYA
jgi:membrane protein